MGAGAVRVKVRVRIRVWVRVWVRVGVRARVGANLRRGIGAEAACATQSSAGEEGGGGILETHARRKTRHVDKGGVSVLGTRLV
tara:strand:- start:430 stop:681 length:252 start_codon:yes stop_codon:yes gene_type:complete